MVVALVGVLGRALGCYMNDVFNKARFIQGP